MKISVLSFWKRAGFSYLSLCSVCCDVTCHVASRKLNEREFKRSVTSRYNYEKGFDLGESLKRSQGPGCGCPWTTHWEPLHYNTLEIHMVIQKKKKQKTYFQVSLYMKVTLTKLTICVLAEVNREMGKELDWAKVYKLAEVFWFFRQTAMIILVLPCSLQTFSVLKLIFQVISRVRLPLPPVFQ